MCWSEQQETAPNTPPCPPYMVHSHGETPLWSSALLWIASTIAALDHCAGCLLTDHNSISFFPLLLTSSDSGPQLVLTTGKPPGAGSAVLLSSGITSAVVILTLGEVIVLDHVYTRTRENTAADGDHAC